MGLYEFFYVYNCIVMKCKLKVSTTRLMDDWWLVHSVVPAFTLLYVRAERGVYMERGSSTPPRHYCVSTVGKIRDGGIGGFKEKHMTMFF